MFSLSLRGLEEKNLFLNYLRVFRFFRLTWIIFMINSQISLENSSPPESQLYAMSFYPLPYPMSQQLSPHTRCVWSFSNLFLCWFSLLSFSGFSLKPEMFILRYCTLTIYWAIAILHSLIHVNRNKPINDNLVCFPPHTDDSVLKYAGTKAWQTWRGA